MGTPELPSRAKPEALHSLCRHLRESGPIEKTDLYDDLDIDSRQIRSAIDYGAKLGFLKLDGDIVALDNRGRVISYNESLDEKAVEDVFQEAIDSYEPYRNAFLRIHAEDLIEEVNGVSCIKQSAFKSGVKKSTGKDYSNREINLLIKTGQAAGLGEFITGRKGLETRLKLTERFEEFMQKLIEDYGVPESSGENKQSVDTKEKEVEEPDVTSDIQTAIKAAAGELKLTVEVDIKDKSEDEIIQMVRDIRKSAY